MYNISKLINYTNYRIFNPLLIKSTKSFSTDNSLTTLKSLDQMNGLAVLDLHFSPANVLKWDFMKHLLNQFQLIEKQFNALIITSSLKCFISGADLNEFYSRKRVYDYIKLFEDICLALYSLPMPTIAAINGHAIAGGCVVANACDYRFIEKSAKFGLNESAIGLSLPHSVYYWPKQILGHRVGTRVCLEGKLLTAEEALRIGWVDGIAEDNTQLMTLSLNKMRELIEIPADAYAGIKRLSQLEFYKNNNQFSDEARNAFVQLVNEDKTNVIIGNLLNSISKKKA